MKETKRTNNKYDWAVIKTEYLTTPISIRKLATKYDIPYNTINSRSNKEKWASEKQSIQSKIEAETKQKATDTVIEEKIKANQRHNGLYEKATDIIDFLLDQYIEEIPRIKAGEVKKGKATPYSLDYLLNAIQKLQKGQRLALNIDDGDIVDDEPEVLIIEGLDIDKI